jgi:hypothetical protein
MIENFRLRSFPLAPGTLAFRQAAGRHGPIKRNDATHR